MDIQWMDEPLPNGLKTWNGVRTIEERDNSLESLVISPLLMPGILLQVIIA